MVNNSPNVSRFNCRKEVRCRISTEIMCDVTKYSNIFQDLKKLQPEDTLQLVMEAKDPEEKDFFEMLGNYLLQQKQKKVIERNLF